MKDMIKKAYRIGYDAAQNGGSMIPVTSQKLMDLIENMKVGSGATDLMKAYQRGFWAAPVQ